MTWKVTLERIIDLDAENVVFAVKIIYLDANVSSEKIMMALVFEINVGSIYIAITLINQDITVLHQIVVLGSEIWYLGIVVLPLVFHLVDIVIKDKYLWILYQKFGDFCWCNICPSL